MEDILSEFVSLKKSGKLAAICIVVETRGSSPGKTGAKMIVYGDKTIKGTIGGGSLELKVIQDALEVISRNCPKKIVYNLDQTMDMHCGGAVEIYIEPVIIDASLYIFGAGHIGSALSKYAEDFGFSISIIDPREEIINTFRDKPVRMISEDYITAAQRIDFSTEDYIVIVTPKHEYDEKLLAICAKKSFAYLGMIGSKSKISLAKQRLLAEKVLTEKELEKVDMPIGIKFNAVTPEEIAISILAKIIDVRNNKR